MSAPGRSSVVVDIPTAVETIGDLVHAARADLSAHESDPDICFDCLRDAGLLVDRWLKLRGVRCSCPAS